jgi:putative nucleotidyltransferase with HDIG domain
MEDWIKTATDWFENYCNSFQKLTDQQQLNFSIKKEHSHRVAQIALSLSRKMNWPDEEVKTAFLIGLLHDIGRFKQLVEHSTFNDEKSVDHAELALKILKEVNPFESLGFENQETLFTAIRYHNKFTIENNLSDHEFEHSKLIRDADKLDIFKVLTDYYSKRNGTANHTLTWELQKGTKVSPEVAKEILAGKLVSKKNVLSEIDVKIMQLSWVYDMNYRISAQQLLDSRYLQIIYNSLPKNDLVIDIYRSIKVFAENKILS